jgi:cytochrome c biogenesis protein CcdA
MNEKIIVLTYLAYICISVALTIWVAHTLHKNGRVFLVDVFSGNEALADSVNHLLVVGFYLINLGYVSLALKIGYAVETWREGIEALSWKVGLVLVVLGGMHFFNLYVFSRIRRRPRFSDAPWTSGRPQEARVWAKES